MEKFAEEYEKSIPADSKPFNGAVHIVCDDGATFFLPNAFFIRHEAYILVFTEHYGRFIFAESDLLAYQQYDPRY